MDAAGAKIRAISSKRSRDMSMMALTLAQNTFIMANGERGAAMSSHHGWTHTVQF